MNDKAEIVALCCLVLLLFLFVRKNTPRFGDICGGGIANDGLRIQEQVRVSIVVISVDNHVLVRRAHVKDAEVGTNMIEGESITSWTNWMWWTLWGWRRWWGRRVSKLVINRQDSGSGSRRRGSERIRIKRKKMMMGTVDFSHYNGFWVVTELVVQMLMR